jgi:hypothetical protein
LLATRLTAAIDRDESLVDAKCNFDDNIRIIVGLTMSGKYDQKLDIKKSDESKQTKNV